MAPVCAAAFAALMAPLGPFEARPRLAVAVSGGADSLALALLAVDWARARGGSVTGFVVDHRLRDGSAAEAADACARLQRHGVAWRRLTLQGLLAGPGLAERARAARYDALRAACAEAGILHLLLGHHAADQAETLAMRELSGSGPAGLAGMAALVETASLRLLRPLLPVPPGRLRATLRAIGESWAEDPSNTDLRAMRPRLRALHADPEGNGPAIRGRLGDSARFGAHRHAADIRMVEELARWVSFHPEGFATFSPGPIAGASLAAALRVVAGRRYPLPLGQVDRLAARPEAATLGGARIIAAGKRGWRVLREAAAMAPPVVAGPGACWDNRFRLGAAELPDSASLGALGDAAAGMRRHSDLPAAILRTLPALRVGAELVAVPHLRYWQDGWNNVRAGWTASPVPAAPAAFVCANFTFADP